MKMTNSLMLHNLFRRVFLGILLLQLFTLRPLPLLSSLSAHLGLNTPGFGLVTAERRGRCRVEGYAYCKYATKLLLVNILPDKHTRYLFIQDCIITHASCFALRFSAFFLWMCSIRTRLFLKTFPFTWR